MGWALRGNSKTVQVDEDVSKPEDRTVIKSYNLSDIDKKVKDFGDTQRKNAGQYYDPKTKLNYIFNSDGHVYVQDENKKIIAEYYTLRGGTYLRKGTE